ncbi:hypothetical protein ART_2918 [Arthrobacter sp. PAMC 25486]|nr:hypothetical protein ART_2918 [Arthrobacter sp. PAMC 25486]
MLLVRSINKATWVYAPRQLFEGRMPNAVGWSNRAPHQ